MEPLLQRVSLGFIPRLALCLGFLICKIEGNNRTWLTGLLGTLNALNIPRPCERCLARQRSDTSAVLVIILQSCSDDEIETHVAPRTGSANGLRCSRPSPRMPRVPELVGSRQKLAVWGALPAPPCVGIGLPTECDSSRSPAGGRSMASGRSMAAGRPCCSVFIWVCLERHPEGSVADGHRARTWHVKGVVFCARSIAEAAALFGLETSSPGGEAEGASKPLVRASVFLIMPRWAVQSGNYFDPSLPAFSSEAPLVPWDPCLALCSTLTASGFSRTALLGVLITPGNSPQPGDSSACSRERVAPGDPSPPQRPLGPVCS